MTTPDATPRARRRRLLLWYTLGSGAGLIVILLLLSSRVPLSSETLRQKVIATLSERLEAEVDLAELKLRVFPRFHAEAVGLTIRHKRRHDVPPLITVKRFVVHADLLGLMRKHVAQVTLEGLDIEIPPGPHHDDEHQTAARGEPQDSGQHADKRRELAREFVVDNLVANDATLVIIPRRTDKDPKTWAIHALRMRTVAFDHAMPFDATLTNAIPPGEITTSGSFGPWQAGEPGATPLEGTFTFAHADLGVFKGIRGILSAHGEFGGSLGRIGIHGETDTPDFTVAVGGHALPLHTDYHATVDGTNGDTLLDRIDAKFLKTSLTAKGSVIDLPGKPGHEVRLDVTMDNARLEDVLKLAVKPSKPPMVASLKLTTKLVLPPGDRDVVEKLRLDGRFAIARATFTDLDVQQKLNELSHRSRGSVQHAEAERVVSNFNGRFKLADGALTLQPLTFATPGARVELTGTYDLQRELLDFKGMLLMDAKISETQTGLKRVFLKVLDPLFKKDGGGSAIPIKIEGSRSAPSFGLDKGRVFHRGG